MSAISDLSQDPLLKDVPIQDGYKALGPAVLHSKLGQGGMGAVYKGRHIRLKIDVAVKVMVLPPNLAPAAYQTYVNRFSREAQAAAVVHHQNLIHVYDVDTSQHIPFLIMEFVDGESVAELLERKGKLPEREALEIVLGAAEGLAKAHENGIVHRDVKPANILISKKGEVKVADLGLAKAVTGEFHEQMTGMSMTGAAFGTPQYMPPEQIDSAKDVSFPADVWALGVTLYQLLTGSLPWQDTVTRLLFNKICEEPLPDIRKICGNISDTTCEIIDKALQKNPAERFADCGEMAKVLRKHQVVQDKLVLLYCDEMAKTLRKHLESLSDIKSSPSEIGIKIPSPPAGEAVSNDVQTLKIDGLSIGDESRKIVIKPNPIKQTTMRGDGFITTEMENELSVYSRFNKKYIIWALAIVLGFSLIVIIFSKIRRDHELKNLRDGIEIDIKECESARMKQKGSKEYIERVASTRMKDWKRAADHGWSEGLWLLGRCYGEGITVEKNESLAFSYYRKAAEQGYAPAQNSVGIRYAKGEGVPQNKLEAVKWYRMAAEQKDASAQCNLGLCYENGDGVPQDKVEALNWWRKSAEQGYPGAQFNVGFCYDKGNGVLQDKTEAVKWYLNAAEQGNADAQCYLGLCYDKGEGVFQDKSEAVKWYRKAAEQGNPYAQTELGLCYALGNGIDKDKNETAKWFQMAADQGFKDARTFLKQRH